MKRYCLIALISMTSLSAALEYGGNTTYSIRQHDTDKGRTNSLWYTHTTTDVGNPQGISFQFLPFVSTAIHTDTIAKHFAHNKTTRITVASDRLGEASETTLPSHAIKHDTTLSPTEESAQIVLDPSLTIAGMITSIFYDAARLQPGFAGTLHIPVFYIDAHINAYGGTQTMADYFAGTYEQTDPIQSSLTAGKLGGTTNVMVGPITAEMTYNVIESARSFAGGTLGISCAVNQHTTQEFLFSNRTAGHDHHKLLAGFDAGTTLWHSPRSKGEILLSARYGYLLGGTEYRILGVQEDDGSIPVHSSYLLGAEKNVAGTFPLANVLHRPVYRSANHQFETNVMAGVTWNDLTVNLGYGFFARREETVTVSSWDENTYAITYPTYDTGAAFANSEATQSKDGVDILLNHRFITEDMLNTQAASSPAQVSVSGFANIGYHGTIRSYPLAIGIGGSYEHSFVAASPSMLSLWGKIAISL